MTQIPPKTAPFPASPPELRPAADIQRAHDLIHCTLALKLAAEDRLALSMACDVLCWVLKHDKGTAFALNLFDLEMEMRLGRRRAGGKGEKGLILWVIG